MRPPQPAPFPAAPDGAPPAGAPEPAARTQQDGLTGVLFAAGAYGLWGLMPIYMKTLAHISPVEVIAHRIGWSVPIALAVLWALGRTADLRAALKSPRMLAMATLTATLISLNWGIYVWAIGAGHALDTALGYYINPLFSVLLGAVLLGERLRPLQWCAIAIAAIGVAIITYGSGRLPVLGLALTVTFGLYAYFKRSLPIGPNQGFALEVILLLPVAIGIGLWFALTGQSHFMTGSARDTWLLVGCGAVTAVPLLFYANGAKRLRLSTIAMMQYIAPTMIFLTAVFIFREPFGGTRLLAFCFIWAALALFTLPLLRRRR